MKEDRSIPVKAMVSKTDSASFSDEVEQQLAQIWENIFNIHSIGVRDNFFDIGGYSLLAVRLFAEIERTFGKNLPLSVLLEAPTIREN
ncbi:MAG: hypothetical protein HC930_16880 [Hydrococcus sp. SU_1_0]|nr:hypothetical protein [Hydrococcus sp. SU_1_0]